MKKKILEFGSNQDYFDDMGPMKKVIPDWYKKVEGFTGGKLDIDPPTISVKHCMPFLDGLTAGYYIPLAVDLLVKNVDGVPTFKWRAPTKLVAGRDHKEFPSLPVPAGYNGSHFIWEMQHCMKVEDGYSLLIMHPLNRYDLPFITLGAIVDANYAMNGGNVPFFLKDGFEGIIPAGTPIAQVIPIKRDKWELVKNQQIAKDAEVANRLSYKYIIGWYKKYIWNKKEYN
jgi:hypothetical protein